MTKLPTKPQIDGTRSGNGIHFTCPACAAKNTIITRTPKDHFKESHAAGCKQCKIRVTILTPSATSHKRAYLPPYPPARS
jgi:hypothetical protein